jgi:hypothetical protein
MVHFTGLFSLCSLHQLKRVFFFKPSLWFSLVEQLHRFDVDVVVKPFFMLSILSSLIHNHLHLDVPVEVGVSSIPRCINNVP